MREDIEAGIDDDLPSFISDLAIKGSKEDSSEELFEHHKVIADKGQSLIRIDKFLADKLPNASRNKIQEAIEAGFVAVNGQLAKASYKIKPQDEVVVSFTKPPRNPELVPENIPLNIVYEDEDVLVVNKPAGMVVHPAIQNWSGTLVNALMYHFNSNLPSQEGNEIRPGLVHRIDKDTSGLLLIAKNEKALTVLSKQFFHHTIERKYFAIAWGVPKEPSGTIDANIGRSPKDRRVMMTFPEGDIGRHAITHYNLEEDVRYVSLISCKLETGRTHQIRSHLRHLGHPLFADEMYGGKRILKGTPTGAYKQFVENCFKICPRQALHAAVLGFKHPKDGRDMYFEAPIPEDMQNLLEKWRSYVQYH